MKQKLLAIALMSVTGAGIGLVSLSNAPIAIAGGAPAVDVGQAVVPAAQRVEVVFVLDTTGSMSELIEAAKEKIWSIASSLASAEQSPEVRIGLVAYRDRGDSYVTRVVGLSSDLDSVYATLMDFEALGGGDGPESVNQALHDAVHGVSWSRGRDAYRAIFLVGDAPPHMDYQDDVKYPVTIAEARQRGIVVNAVLAGTSPRARTHWERIAKHGHGVYAQVEQGGNAVTVATPFDERLAELSKRLDETRMFYGSAETMRALGRKQAATEKLHDEASVATRARRATFNASRSGRKNLLGESELVDDVASGRVELDRIDPAHLPEPLKALPKAEQAARIEEAKSRRETLERQIRALSDQRAEFLRKEVDTTGRGADSLDRKLYDAVRAQAAESGISYSSDAPSY